MGGLAAQCRRNCRAAATYWSHCALPEGWTEWTGEEGKTWYHHTETNRTTWCRPRRPQFHVGHAIEGKRDGRWYPGKVVEANDDSTYKIEWADGNHTADFGRMPGSIRLRVPTAVRTVAV